MKSVTVLIDTDGLEKDLEDFFFRLLRHVEAVTKERKEYQTGPGDMPQTTAESPELVPDILHDDDDAI